MGLHRGRHRALRMLPPLPFVLFALVLGASWAATPPTHAGPCAQASLLDGCLPVAQAAEGLQQCARNLMLKLRQAAADQTWGNGDATVGCGHPTVALGATTRDTEVAAPEHGEREYATLVLVRHGMSIWNKDNRFTAWMDVPLSGKGLDDAQRAARLCNDADIKFDIAFTSVLQRAVKTCNIILEEIGRLWIPTVCTWRLNERHDGVLTGLNKKMAVVQFGQQNVSAW